MSALSRLSGRVQATPPAPRQLILLSRTPDWIPVSKAKLSVAIDEFFNLLAYVTIDATTLWDGTQRAPALVVYCGFKRLDKSCLPAYRFVQRSNITSLKQLVLMNQAELSCHLADQADLLQVTAFFIELLNEVTENISQIGKLSGGRKQILQEGRQKALRQKKPFEVVDYQILRGSRPRLNGLAMIAREQVGVPVDFADEHDFTEPSGEFVGRRAIYCAVPDKLKEMYLAAIGTIRITLKLPAVLGAENELLIRANGGEELEPAEKEWLAQNLVRAALDVIAINSDVVGRRSNV